MTTTIQFTEGQPIRYVGTMPELVGKTGTFHIFPVYDLYSGARIGSKFGIVNSKDGFGYYVDEDEIEAV
jgi:hypothetical protein